MLKTSDIKAVKILSQRLKEARLNAGAQNMYMEAIAGLQATQAKLDSLKHSQKIAIEEIQYALKKPEYLDIYLNNAIRFLLDEGKEQ